MQVANVTDAALLFAPSTGAIHTRPKSGLNGQTVLWQHKFSLEVSHCYSSS